MMLTTHHQVVGKCNRSEACEFTGGNNLGRETLCFTGIVPPGVAEVGFLFPQLWASIWQSCRQKVHKTAAGAGFTVQKAQRLLLGTFRR